jgi:hypothetical protein
LGVPSIRFPPALGYEGLETRFGFPALQGDLVMSLTKGLVAIAVVFSVATGSLGCHREKGTMEKAGEKVDEMVDDIAHPNEGTLEKAGRKIDEKVKDAKE